MVFELSRSCPKSLILLLQSYIDFQCLWIVFLYKIDDTEFDFWRRHERACWKYYVYIYIYDFYMMTYMRVVILVLRVLFELPSDVYVATRSIWTDLGRDRIWAWYMLWCAPFVGSVAGVSTMTDVGRNGDATVSPRGLSRPTPMVGLDIWYMMVLLY